MRVNALNGYHIKTRSDIKEFIRKWYIWIGVYFILYIVGAAFQFDFGVNEIFTYFQIDITSIIPESLLRGAMTLVIVIFLLLIAIILAKICIWGFWKLDIHKLRKKIISYPSRLSILVKQNSETALKCLELKAKANLWQLIFLRSYINILEARIRQVTLAPALLLETPLYWSSQYFQIPSSLYPQFTEEETDLLQEILKKETTFSRINRVSNWILSRRPFRRELPAVKILMKGISKRDYINENSVRLAKWLDMLTEDSNDYSALFDKESIKSIVRLADKQYDFHLKRGPFEDLKGGRNWRISWREDSKNITLANGEEIPLLELTNCINMTVELGYNSPQSSYENTDSTILLSGYKIIPKDYKKLQQYYTNIRLKERVATYEKLERRHREVLKDVIIEGFRGSTIRLLDTSNLMMAFQTLVRRQYTLKKITEGIEQPSTIQRAVLRINTLPQVIQNLSHIDGVNSGHTLSTSGIVGLKSISEKTRKAFYDFCIKLGIIVEDVKGPSRVGSLNSMAVPQLTEHIGLQETRGTERFAERRSFGWSATGGGAWILKENLLQSFTGEVEDPPVRKWYVLFHHPLRERVFLEVLTHKNYHYLTEIIKNRVQFQCEIMKRNLKHFKLLWSREAFHPSSNYVVLNDSSMEILDKIITVHKAEHRSDTCIMLTKSNMLIRNPVSGLNLLLAEDSQSLSPIAAFCHDITLRQRTYEMVADCISKEEGLVKEGRPTPLSLRVNWLSPLNIGDELNSEIQFDKHCFSNPETWYQQGFLEIIVREVKCAYSILKILDWYSSCLRNNTSLPFKVTQQEPQVRIENDIRDMDESFDNLCDFLTGEGDFRLEGVTAVSGDRSYLDWLEKAIKQLPEIGRSLGSEKIFIDCIRNTHFWLKRLRDFFENRDLSLSYRIDEILNESH